MEQEGKTNKKSIPRNIIFKKSGSNTKGEWHLFEITFDNGDKGMYFAKSNPQTDFKEGVEIDYILEKKYNNDFLNTTIYLPSKVKGGKGYNPSAANKQCALNNATNLFIAGKTIRDKSMIIDMADILFNWLQKDNTPKAND